MEMTAELQEALDRLNDQQRDAVEHLDGPLLVVAGPGTGKTQLLSLRAANILVKRDAAPRNILCLTYTEAGAEAMRKRLIELIGRDAYEIEVSTFHGFASAIRSRYPQHFERPASDRLVTSLRQNEIMDDLLKRQPFGSPLASIGRGGRAYYSPAMLAFVSKVKRSGLSYDVLSAIAQQNIETAEWLEGNSTICELVSQRKSPRVIEEFEAEVERAFALAPDNLKRRLTDTPGVYVTFLEHFRNTVRNTTLIDEDDKTTGFDELRKAFFAGTNRDGRYLKIRPSSEKLQAACKVARLYQETLDKACFYDFDDMIFDFVHAVETNDELRQTLQDTYTYIQLDEFQDTNGAQMRIVELLCKDVERPNVMAVGDDDQAIMRFQGASIECINQFTGHYSPRSIVLKTNYRSTPAVVELGQKVATQVECRLPASEDKQIEAHRKDGEQTAFHEMAFSSKAEEYAALAADLRARIDAGYISSCEKPDEAIAIIAPKHATLLALIPHLIAHDIPFAYKQTENLFTAERMQATLALVECVSHLSQGRAQLAASYLPQIVAAPEFGGNHPSSVQFALKAKREHHGDWFAAMRETADERIRTLYANLMDWAAKAPASPVRELLFDMAARPLAYYRHLSESDPLAAAGFNAGMRAMLAFVEGELDAAADLGRALRLADVVERLEEARRYGVSIDASIDLGAPGAVRLTSAHSSKGLEFDCVYLADADDATWHTGASGGGLYPDNLLIGDEKDEDDARRLLFVAVTRAKRHLELYRAGATTLRELSGEITTQEVAQDPLALDDAIETDWHRSYRLDTPELAALVDPKLDVAHLSASALNAFVTYEEGCANSTSFPERRIMRLPEEPKIHFEFGGIVHGLMEDVSNLVMGAQKKNLDEVVTAHRKLVAWMDFPEKDVAQYLQRFDRITETFVPWLMENTADYRRVTEAKVEAQTKGGTPLLGFLDLMLVDDEEKTVHIVDYKTGFSYTVSAGYERQLRFYKLMVESAPEFKGYRVASMGDFYVEPEKDSGQLHKPLAVTAHKDEIASLELLVDAVWKRIQAGAWDTSDFEGSELHEQALARQADFRNATDKAKVMQLAYEQWLVNNPAN